MGSKGLNYYINVFNKNAEVGLVFSKKNLEYIPFLKY